MRGSAQYVMWYLVYEGVLCYLVWEGVLWYLMWEVLTCSEKQYVRVPPLVCTSPPTLFHSSKRIYILL